MTASVLFGKKGAKIGILQLDATVNENHDYQNEVSEYPTEDGDTIIDNIRLLPERVTINGLVSNAPLDVRFDDITNVVDGNSNTSESRTVARQDTPTRVETAQNILLRISGRVIQGQPVKPEIITIVTGLRVYKNMAMTSLKISRNATTGRALPFTADFKNVETVELAFIEPQPDFKDKASTKKQKGKQTPSPASAKTAEKANNDSIAFKAAKRATSFFGGLF